jgi:CHAD domain-containing protein
MSSALPELAPDVPFAAAGRAVLRHQLDLLLGALPGVFEGDVDAIHDLRVATRRLRSSLSVFAKLFSPEAVREAERQISRLTGAFGAVRDLDVQIEALRAIAAPLPDDQRFGVERTIARLVRRRTEERKNLKKVLAELEKGKLERRLKRLLGELA